MGEGGGGSERKKGELGRGNACQKDPLCLISVFTGECKILIG